MRTFTGLARMNLALVPTPPGPTRTSTALELRPAISAEGGVAVPVRLPRSRAPFTRS